MTGSTINDLNNIEQLVLELEGNLKEAKGMRDLTYSTFEKPNWWLIASLLVGIVGTLIAIYMLIIRKKESQRPRNEKIIEIVISPLIRKKLKKIKERLHHKGYHWGWNRQMEELYNIKLYPSKPEEKYYYGK